MGLGKTLSTVALVLEQASIERERGGPFRREYLNELRERVMRENLSMFAAQNVVYMRRQQASGALEYDAGRGASIAHLSVGARDQKALQGRAHAEYCPLSRSESSKESAKVRFFLSGGALHDMPSGTCIGLSRRTLY